MDVNCIHKQIQKSIYFSRVIFVLRGEVLAAIFVESRTDFVMYIQTWLLDIILYTVIEISIYEFHEKVMLSVVHLGFGVHHGVESMRWVSSVETKEDGT